MSDPDETTPGDDLEERTDGVLAGLGLSREEVGEEAVEALRRRLSRDDAWLVHRVVVEGAARGEHD